MIRVMGKVYLGALDPYAEFLDTARFTTDPKIERAWPPRRARLPGVGGSVTQQDFGRFAADMRLTLTSDGNWINAEFKAYLDALCFQRNQTYDYKDYQGIEATVVIADFAPRPTFIRDGESVLWEYALVLDVTELSTLDFATYSGN